MSRHAGARRRPDTRRLVLLGTADLLLTVALLGLLYVAWILLYDDASVRAEQSRRADGLVATWQDATPVARSDGGVPPLASPRPGASFAVLRIPRLGEDWRRPVVEGTTLDDLDGGIGHYRGSALPGQVGNFAVAGHRLTHGSALREIDRLRLGDRVVVETAAGWYVYRVTGSLVVTPDRVDVVAPVPEQPGVAATSAVLTLTSCDPLFGSSHRYVVHASLESTRARADGPPRGV